MNCIFIHLPDVFRLNHVPQANESTPAESAFPEHVTCISGLMHTLSRIYVVGRTGKFHRPGSSEAASVSRPVSQHHQATIRPRRNPALLQIRLKANGAHFCPRGDLLSLETHA